MPRVVSESPSLEQAMRALALAPGPTPWYATNTIVTDRARGPLHFRKGDDPSATFLCDSDDNVLAVFGSYCWIKVVAPGRFLVWYERRLIYGPGLQSRTIVVRLYDSDRLRPIDDRADACARVKSESVVTADGASALTELLVPNWVENGVGFEDDGLEPDRPQTVLWHVEPERRTLTVHPQRWFNEGDYDFGYDWPTTIAREPDTGTVVGSGIRLGVFVLSEDLRNVTRWLKKY
jgi:hypothetical protein